MRSARVRAQAKINLWLRVGQRSAQSGYHDVHTLLHRIDLADEIVVRVGGDRREMRIAGPRVPAAGLGPVEKNLAYRAALEYSARADWLRGFSIELVKHIPVGGGLGGGSADAGAVLRALDALSPSPLGDAALRAIGATLGADVAFLASAFVAAVGTGRGELLRPVNALPARPVLIVVPDFAIGTADAYRWLDESRGDLEPVFPVEPAGAIGWDVVARLSDNDFEPVVEERHPRLREARTLLAGAGARIARLAGSGSSVFGVFDGEAPDAASAGAAGAVLTSSTSTRVVPVQRGE